MSTSGVLKKSSSENLKNPNAILLSKNDVIQLRLNKIQNYSDKEEM